MTGLHYMFSVTCPRPACVDAPPLRHVNAAHNPANARAIAECPSCARQWLIHVDLTEITKGPAR